MEIAELIKHPERLDRDTLYELRSMLALYPYFQTARLLMLQNLYLLHDPSFDEELRRAAIYITDRRVLFQMIENLFKGVNFLVWLVGLGTLLAGAIGVSNIMMVTSSTPYQKTRRKRNPTSPSVSLRPPMPPSTTWRICWKQKPSKTALKMCRNSSDKTSSTHS